MRNLDFTKDSPQSVKLGDSKDILSLLVTESDKPVDLSNVSSITVKIGNTEGYLTETNVDVSSLQHPTDGIIDVVIDSDISRKLPAGSYLLEVWINDSKGNTVIYPDTSYPTVIGFSIKKNIMTATSNVITTLTLTDFKNKFDDMQEDLQYKMASGYFKGDKGETGNTVIIYPYSVTYKINSDGTMLVTFVKNDQSQVIISYPGVQKRVPVEASYTLKDSEALVYNSLDNSLVATNFDSLFHDSLIIIGNYHGKITSNNINAVQGDGDYEYYSDGTENVIYAGGTVTARKNGTSIDVKFDLSGPQLYYKDCTGNHVIMVTNSMYTVPHNFSLVLNRETKSLEVINTDNVIRGVHSILITCHQGFAKKVGMYFNSLKTDDIKLPTSEKIPINRYKTFVGQDATKVGNEYWLFDGSTPDHVSTSSIHRINPTDFSEIGLITHNLGHANGVDYRDNTLLVYNGGALPPEINLYKNPDNTMTNLKIQDAVNTQIIFKESSKLLPGDGSACFGLDNKIVYYAYCAGTQVIILKILLGLGDNDLSDKTTDKSDNQHWGSFVSGKSTDEYNGTAQIISSYTGDISGDNQPQGMAFNGDLYMGISHAEQKAYRLQLFDDGSYKVVDNYKSEMTDYKNNVIGLEPEITFIDTEKRSIFVGGRGSLSNVAEFNL